MPRYLYLSLTGCGLQVPLSSWPREPMLLQVCRQVADVYSADACRAGDVLAFRWSSPPVRLDRGLPRPRGRSWSANKQNPRRLSAGGLEVEQPRIAQAIMDRSCAASGTSPTTRP